MDGTLVYRECLPILRRKSKNWFSHQASRSHDKVTERYDYFKNEMQGLDATRLFELADRSLTEAKKIQKDKRLRILSNVFRLALKMRRVKEWAGRLRHWQPWRVLIPSTTWRGPLLWKRLLVYVVVRVQLGWFLISVTKLALLLTVFLPRERWATQKKSIASERAQKVECPKWTVLHGLVHKGNPPKVGETPQTQAEGGTLEFPFNNPTGVVAQRSRYHLSESAKAFLKNYSDKKTFQPKGPKKRSCDPIFSSRGTGT